MDGGWVWRRQGVMGVEGILAMCVDGFALLGTLFYTPFFYVGLGIETMVCFLEIGGMG